MKKVRSKNGFTLVELIVVIALMISILVIAIVSFTNISSSKKSESWSYVKQEIETAAEEYFTSNEYLFEGLGDETTEGTISLGKLVSLGYLSSVTDPRTGETLSSCTVVNITKTNGVLTATLNEDSIDYDENGSCDGSASLSIKLAATSAPEFDLTYYKDSSCSDNKEAGTPTSSGYFNISNLETKGTLYVKITPTSPSSVQSYSVKIGNTTTNTVATGKDSYCVKVGQDGEYELEVTLTGKNEKSSTESTEFKIDTVAPTCSISFDGTKGNGKWYIGDSVDIELNKEDKENNGYSSTIAGYHMRTFDEEAYLGTYFHTKTTDSDPEGQTWYGYVKDYAGNTGNCTNTLYYETKVTLTFDYKTTNNATASSSGSAVFNTSKASTCTNTGSIITYNSGKSGNCTRNGSTGCASNSGTSGVTYYYGRSCEYIGDYKRSFYVTAVSDGYSQKSIYWYNDKSSVSGLEHIESGTYASYSKKVSNPDSVFFSSSKKYTASSLNNSGDYTNFTMHAFKYTSTAGNTSNIIVLYTEYSINCGYGSVSCK